jgi:hypothetical protein
LAIATLSTAFLVAKLSTSGKKASKEQGPPIVASSGEEERFIRYLTFFLYSRKWGDWWFGISFAEIERDSCFFFDVKANVGIQLGILSRKRRKSNRQDRDINPLNCQEGM